MFKLKKIKGLERLRQVKVLGNGMGSDAGAIRVVNSIFFGELNELKNL
jgi:hypothetical protein